MKNTVYYGFIAVILIMTTLAFVWLAQIKTANDSVMDLIELYDIKINHAQMMHSAIRKRQVLLLSMLVTNDAFEIDDLVQEFYEVAYDYRASRKALHELPMSQKEISIHKILDEQALASQPTNNRAAEMFMEGYTKNEIIKVINEAGFFRDILLDTLEQFVELQKKQDKGAVIYSRKMFDDSIYWVSFLGLIAITVAIIISRYVGKAVAEKNRQLFEAGREMAVAYQKAEEATIIKSEFLATMSHEIRTPLTAIIGFAGTMLFSEQTLEQRQNAIHTIIRSGKHLLQIINDILDLSKVEANKLEIENTDIPLFVLLHDVERLVRPAAVEKGLGFSINYIFPLPKKIISDSLRVKQILINLCNNAIKFTQQGHVVINVSCDCGKTANHLSFEVIDSGIGMTKEQMDMVFQAYRQADSSTTRKYGGTGLGLSLSRLLAKRLGGSITVESEIDKGSKFKFLLETNKQDGSEAVFDKEHLPQIHQAKIPSLPTKHLSGHILLAEDNEDNQQLLLMYLHRMGVEVTVVENGELAVKAVEESDFDLILMDMRMPVMGGLEATKILRQHEFKKPIVALTANAMQEDRDACFKAGCDAFLTKPVDITQLSETLDSYLEITTVENKDEVSVVSSLLDDDPEAIDLIKRYVHKLADTLKGIEESIEKKDWENLSDILHQLKGTGGNFGYPIISILAGKMEFQVASKNENELSLLYSELKENHQQILNGLE